MCSEHRKKVMSRRIPNFINNLFWRVTKRHLVYMWIVMRSSISNKDCLKKSLVLSLFVTWKRSSRKTCSYILAIRQTSWQTPNQNKDYLNKTLVSSLIVTWKRSSLKTCSSILAIRQTFQLIKNKNLKDEHFVQLTP